MSDAWAGRVRTELDVIDGVAAEVPADRLAALQASPGVLAVTADAEVTLAGGAPPPAPRDGKGKKKSGLAPFADPTTANSFPTIAGTTDAIGAPDLWRRGITGRGVGVALIDSGIAPVAGLNAPGKVINGPDLSFDSQSEALRHLDGFGHGTHMGGIIAGSDSG